MSTSQKLSSCCCEKHQACIEDSARLVFILQCNASHQTSSHQTLTDLSDCPRVFPQSPQPSKMKMTLGLHTLEDTSGL
ncbi:hypothetical protein EXN66_Car012778 [Channa argus]|uniref:Uncharacterized protein n=1 Tax=Channa argus TaxID=215402 RepID=A0A6G1Q4A8_CHAAH|nr:hypothetical protein EXN66_Car012778 [Channa argus]